MTIEIDGPKFKKTVLGTNSQNSCIAIMTGGMIDVFANETEVFSDLRVKIVFSLIN